MQWWPKLWRGFSEGTYWAPCLRGENGEGYPNGAAGSIFYVLLMLLGFHDGWTSRKLLNLLWDLKTCWSVFHLGKPAVGSFIYFGLCRGISDVLKSLLCHDSWFAPLNILLMFQDVVSGPVNLLVTSLIICTLWFWQLKLSISSLLKSGKLFCLFSFV